VALFGGSANVLWAQNIEEVIPELSRQAHDQHMQRYWDDPVTRPLDNRDRLAALRQDRTWISVAIMLNQVDLLDGRYVVAMCRDMSGSNASRTIFMRRWVRKRRCRALIQ